MSEKSIPLAARALAAMLYVQALTAMAALTIPVLAPSAAAEIGLDANYVGVYSGILYVGAMTSAAMASGFVLRFGAVRSCQVSLLLCALGLAGSASANWLILAVAAIVIGFGYGPTTPASSHLLARHTPPHLLSFVFSLKQTGVPIGGVVAGAMLPALVLEFGWRTAALAAAALCVVGAVVIEITRGRFDVELKPGAALWRGGLVGPVVFVLSRPGLRQLALTSFTFAAMQQSLAVFMVALMVSQNGMSLVAAGFVLSIAQGAGIAGRIFWGALADRLRNGQLVLGLIALGMSVCGVASAFFSPAWPYYGVVGVIAVFGATAIGWNGVYLAEVSRLVREDEASRATGGSLAVTFAGVVVAPPIFGGLAVMTGSYETGFLVLAGLTMISAISILAGARSGALRPVRPEPSEADAG
jgi:MFS family permease